MGATTATVDGIHMRWEETGQGRPVVLLHGIPTNPRLWRHVTPLLRQARLLAWEMVGYGGSIAEGEGRDISVAQQAEYLAAWLRHLGIERPVVVGHDLGGGVAQILAVRHPGLVGGLVLTNAITHDSWPIPAVKLLRAAGLLTEKLPNPAVKAIFWILLQRGHEDAERANEALEVHWPFYDQTDASGALLRQVESLDTNDTLAVSDHLSILQIPARIVWGAADEFQKIEYGERLAQQLKAPLDAIEGGKHFVPEDHPDRVAAAIREVVASVDKGLSLPG